MSKAYTKWMARINNIDTPWTEQEIIYFRKAIGLAGIKDRLLRDSLLIQFDLMVANHEYSITVEQDYKGLTYLMRKSFKANGQPRKGSKLGQREALVLANFSHHTFIGLWTIQGNWYLPIYRAYAVDGSYFDYTGTTYEQMMVFGGGRRAA